MLHVVQQQFTLVALRYVCNFRDISVFIFGRSRVGRVLHNKSIICKLCDWPDSGSWPITCGRRTRGTVGPIFGRSPRRVADIFGPSFSWWTLTAADEESHSRDNFLTTPGRHDLEKSASALGALGGGIRAGDITSAADGTEWTGVDGCGRGWTDGDGSGQSEPLRAAVDFG